MAAEALEEKAKEMGVTIKVETNGSGGAKNILTAKEIEECQGIIVAADKNVEMARFNGKPVIQVKVADGINKAEQLIQEALSDQAPIYHADHQVNEIVSESEESLGRQIYKHLMNRVNHMLPFVIGGGNLIVLAFLFDDYSIDPSNFGKNTVLATFFFKNCFTQKEQQTTLTNFIMGLSFITEGAIPFAASDPLHILPACVVGSAVAGALSMFFNCTLMAPHGGIFVIGVISHPVGYLIALVIGSIVGMLGLALLKKTLK